MACWELSEASGNAIDVHSTHDLTETSGTIGAASGPSGLSGARDFELTDSEYFILADNASLRRSDIDYTVAIWVNLESKATTQSIISKLGASNYEYELNYRQSTDLFRWTVFGGGGTSIGMVEANTFGFPSTATWYFIIAKHLASSNTVTIKVNNGTTDSSATSGAAGGSTLASQRIGDDGFGSYLDGLAAQGVLWDRSISGAEETELWAAGAGLPFTGWGGGAAAAGPLIGGKLAESVLLGRLAA